MATTTTSKAAPPMFPTTVAPVAAPTPAIAPAVAKDAPSLHKDSVKTNIKPDVPPKSPVLNGHSKPHSNPSTPCKPGTPRSGHDHHCHGFTRGYNEVTHIGQPYCPNPNLPNICKDYETKVRVIQRVPEMRTVEKTFFVKQLGHEDRVTKVRKNRVITVDVEELVMVPVIKEVTRMRKIKVHKIEEEIRTHHYEAPVIEYERRCTIKRIPRVHMVDVEEEVEVPVVREVPKVRTIQVPTGEFCEEPIEDYCTPGDYNLLCKDGRHHGEHHKHRAESSSSSSSDAESSDEDSDDEDSHSSPKHGKLATPINTTKPSLGHDHEPNKSLSPKHGKLATPINTTKPSLGHDHEPNKSLSPIKTKPLDKPKEEHKPLDKPKEGSKLPLDKPKEEHKLLDKPKEGPKMPLDKPKEEHKPLDKPKEEHKPLDKPKEEHKLLDKPKEGPKLPLDKPKEEHKPLEKPKEGSKLPLDKPKEEPKSKLPHEVPTYSDTKPKPLEPESKPKVPTPNAVKGTKFQ